MGSLLQSLKEVLSGSNTLYYPGCLTKMVSKNLQQNYEEILRLSGIEFIMLSDGEACCGSPVRKAGYEEDFQKLVEKNKRTFREHSVRKIITNCPACFGMFHSEYGMDGITVEHATQTVKNALEKGALKVKKSAGGEKITYHDPCHLGRYEGLYDAPRDALMALGYQVIEMKRTRENSLCCGGGGGLRSNFEQLSNKIAKTRLSEASETGAKKIVTPCPMCFEHFLENSEKKGIKAMEFSQVVLDAVK